MRYPGVDFGSARIEGRFPALRVAHPRLAQKERYRAKPSRTSRPRWPELPPDGQSTGLSKSYQLGEMDPSGQDSLIEDAVRAVGLAVHEQARPYASAGDEFVNFNCTGRILSILGVGRFAGL